MSTPDPNQHSPVQTPGSIQIDRILEDVASKRTAGIKLSPPAQELIIELAVDYATELTEETISSARRVRDQEATKRDVMAAQKRIAARRISRTRTKEFALAFGGIFVGLGGYIFNEIAAARPYGILACAAALMVGSILVVWGLFSSSE